MSRDPVSKAAQIAGTTALVFGGAFGIAASADAKAVVLSKHDFKAKLTAISAAVEQGEIFQIVDDGTGAWVKSEKSDLRVADWLQTWTKASTNWGKV